MSRQHHAPQSRNYDTQLQLYPFGFSVSLPCFTPFANNWLTETQGYQFLLKEAREIRFTGRGILFIFSYDQIIKALLRS